MRTENWKRLCAPAGYGILLSLFLYACQMLCNYLVRLELTDGYSNTPYHKDSIVFVFSAGDKDRIDLSGLEQEGFMPGSVLLKYNDGAFEWNEVIYGNGDGETSGFCSGSKTAAAGADSGYAVGDTVVIDGAEYTVKEVLEEHISAAVNRGIFYSKCDLSRVPVHCAYVLTARDKDRIAGAYRELEAFGERHHFALKKLEISEAKFSDYVDYERQVAILLVILGLFSVCLNILLLFVWLRIKTPEIHVLHLLGYAHAKRRIWLEYSVVCLCAGILSLGSFLASAPCYDLGVIVALTLCDLGVMQAAYFFLFPKGCF